MMSPVLELHAAGRREAAMQHARQQRERRADRPVRPAVRARLARRLTAAAGRLDPAVTGLR